MKRLPRILAHAAIVLILVLLTLLVFDYFNPSMDFINNAMTKVMIGVLCALSFLNAYLVLIATKRK
ncbi:MAG: hypothetical protein IJN61_03695 [Clostridia bacterium]|nr:hypothetical protein [Clostridia bacterium]